MNHVKPAAVTGVIVLALAAIPIIWQESKAKQLREEIAVLDQRETQAAATIEQFEANRLSIAGSKELASARTVRNLIAHSEQRVDIEEMMNSMMSVMMSQDIVGMLKMFLPLADLDRDEYNRLLEELEAYEGNAQSKMMMIQMMTMFAPTDDPAGALERLVRLGVEPYSYSNLLNDWASDDPAAAVAWYETKLEAGELDGKGINSHGETYLLSQLIAGMAKSDPKSGMDFFLKNFPTPSYENASGAMTGLANSIGVAMKENPDDSQLQRLLEWDSDGSNRHSLVQSVMNGALQGEEFADVTRFAETYLEDPAQQQSAVISHVMNQREEPVAERAAQLVGYLPEDRAPDAIRQITNNGYRSNTIDPENQGWVESQPPGPIRDAGWRGIADNQLLHENFEEAFEVVGSIGDEGQRAEALLELGNSWFQDDEEAARAALPAETIAAIEADQASNNPPIDTSFIHEEVGEILEAVAE